MLLGPTYIIECPKCTALLKKASLASGNTFGAQEYSDGKFEAPMLREFPVITICDKCSNAFWIDKAKEVGSFNRLDKSAPAEWRNARQVRFPETEEYFSILGTSFVKNQEDEFYIRQRILWDFNDRDRDRWNIDDSDGSLSQDDFEKWQGNILALIRILNRSHLNGYKKLLLAELYRNLGDFENCEKIMHSIKGYELLWIKDNFLRECKRRNTKVFRLVMNRDNKEIVLFDVISNGYNLGYSSEALRDDREVVLAAVRNWGSAIQFASARLRSDKEIALEAVKKDGHALKFVSEKLRDDKEVVLQSINMDFSEALKHASKKLQADEELVLKAASKNDGFALRYAAEELWNNREFVFKVIEKAGDKTFPYVPRKSTFWSDRELVLLAVKADGANIQFATKELRSDREIVMEAVKQYEWTIQFASKELQNDEELILAALPRWWEDLKK